MSASGNIRPQSTTRMRSATSRQKQLRPISPTPPRNTIRTGVVGDAALIDGSGYRLHRDVHVGVVLARVGPVLELDHAELGETRAEPAVARVEQAELLAVG